MRSWGFMLSSSFSVYPRMLQVASLTHLNRGGFKLISPIPTGADLIMKLKISFCRFNSSDKVSDELTLAVSISVFTKKQSIIPLFSCIYRFQFEASMRYAGISKLNVYY
jgi:hypothetical protein